MSIPSTTAAAAAKKTSEFVEVPTDLADRKFWLLVKGAPLEEGEDRRSIATTWLSVKAKKGAQFETFVGTTAALLPKCWKNEIPKQWWDFHAEETPDVLLLPFQSFSNMVKTGPLGKFPSEEHKVWQEKKTKHELITAQLLVAAEAPQPKKGAVGMLKGFLFGSSEVEQTPLEKHGEFELTEPPVKKPCPIHIM